MKVELGNVAPKMADGSPANLGAPVVTYVTIPEPPYEWAPENGAFDASAVKLHLADALTTKGGVTNLPGHEPLLSIVHPSGLWGQHSASPASWVWSDNDDFAAALGQFFGCPVGRPEGIEDTHFTVAGGPGIVPGAVLDLKALLVNSGRDMWAKALGGGVTGFASTSTGATGATSTTLQDSAQTWTVNQWQGCRVIVSYSSQPPVWGNVIWNNGTTLQVDRWYTPGTPGGAAGTTPVGSGSGAGCQYTIVDGAPPSWFVGLGSTNTASVATDVWMTSEIVTTGGGLIRKIAPWAHSAGTNTYTLSPVYTANANDALPITTYRIGVFNTLVWATGSTGPSGPSTQMAFETLLSASATLSSSGDQLSVVSTVTGS